MIKKVIVSTLLVGLVGGLTAGGDAVSYLSTVCHRASDSFERSVPTEFQLDHARQILRDMTPEIRRSREVVATEEIELERLGEQIDKAAAKAEKSKIDILRLKADLMSGDDEYQYKSGTYSREQVIEDLSRRFTRHKLEDETLEHLRKMRNARERNLQAARERLTTLAAQQRELEAEITELDTQRQLVLIAQTSSDVVALDESKLSRVKGLLTKIRTRLDVAAHVVAADTSFPGEIQLDGVDEQDVPEQIAAYFGVESDDTGKVAAVSASITLD